MVRIFGGTQMREANSCWIKRGTSKFTPSDNIVVVEELDPGAYKVSYDPYNDIYHANKMTIDNTSLIKIPQKEVDEVVDNVKDFYAKQEEFKKWNFPFKRGILLHGIPGGGKTSIISQIIEFVVNDLGGVAFVLSNEVDVSVYSKFYKEMYRKIEPTRLIVTVFEDIDGMTRDETTLINVLDGLGDIGNVFNIGTTNYPEYLSDRIANRPSRFDRKIEIKSLDAAGRRFFFENKILPDYLQKTRIDHWVEKTEGYTVAQLSEIVKSVFLLGCTFDEVITTLEGMKQKVTSHDHDKETLPGIGFGQHLGK
jgi:SpoVK/Ycf46/Vps4 family AAA+-type ATPase